MPMVMPYGIDLCTTHYHYDLEQMCSHTLRLDLLGALYSERRLNLLILLAHALLASL